jgi:hypothetical protein
MCRIFVLPILLILGMTTGCTKAAIGSDNDYDLREEAIVDATQRLALRCFRMAHAIRYQQCMLTILVHGHLLWHPSFRHELDIMGRSLRPPLAGPHIPPALRIVCKAVQGVHARELQALPTSLPFKEDMVRFFSVYRRIDMESGNLDLAPGKPGCASIVVHFLQRHDPTASSASLQRLVEAYHDILSSQSLHACSTQIIQSASQFALLFIQVSVPVFWGPKALTLGLPYGSDYGNDMSVRELIEILARNALDSIPRLHADSVALRRFVSTFHWLSFIRDASFTLQLQGMIELLDAQLRQLAEVFVDAAHGGMSHSVAVLEHFFGSRFAF